MSFSPTRRSPGSRHVSSALLGALAALFTCAQCSREPVAPPADDEPQPRLLTTQEILGIQAPEKPLYTGPVYPVLAFEDHSAGLPRGGTWRQHPLLADFDGDGLADLAASNREEEGLHVWRNVPNVGWEARNEGIERNLMYGGSAAADFDRDGHLDLFFVPHKRLGRVFLNQGGPEMRWKEVEGGVPSPFLALDVAVGRLNRDEHLDAISIAQFAVPREEGGLNVYLGRGDGTFERQDHLANVMGMSRMGNQVELADFDRDGLDDLLLTAERGTLLFLTRVDEAGELSFVNRSRGLPAPDATMRTSFRSAVAADFTGDGELEIAFCRLANPGIDLGKRNNVGVYRWIAETEEQAGHWKQIDRGLPRDNAYKDVLAADLNGDEKCDLLLIGPGFGAVVFLGDGTGGFEVAGMLPGTVTCARGALGDVDADGKLDIALIGGATKSRRDGGTVLVFLNRDDAWK